MNTLHIYRQRHIFFGDDLIGKYHVPSRTIRLFTAHERHGPAVKAHYIRHFGIITRLVISDEEPAPKTTLQQLHDFQDDDATAPATTVSNDAAATPPPVTKKPAAKKKTASRTRTPRS